MKIKSDNTNPLKKKTSLLCAFILENSNQPLGLGKINSKIDSAIKQSIKETEGKIGKLSIINTLDLLPAKKILLAGLGDKKKISNDSFRFTSGKIAQKARDLGVSEFSIIVPKGVIKEIEAMNQIVEGVKLSLYSFDKFKNKKAKKSPDLSLLISKSDKAVKAIREAQIVADGAIFTKSVSNLPPNECTPATLASFAKSIASRNKMKCIILAKSELKKKGFGGISAVGQGSKNEPKLIVLEHNKGRRIEKPIVIVGKAVTFDTGGISIKPSEKMDEMKFDKCGGCTVMGIMKAVSELKLPINLVGIVPSVENMPGGESYRPGDIVKLYSGKTAEILNTDAEGRLILADALAYGEKKYSPKAIIDFATLTGACIVALGTNVAGLVSNNQSLTNYLKKSSERTTEEIWELHDKIRSCRYEKYWNWTSCRNYNSCCISKKCSRENSLGTHRYCRSCLDTNSYKRKTI
jgi:leucyl aminopeptidase